MSREIKFRAWDNKRKIFVPQGEIVFSDYGDTRFTVIPNDLLYVGDSCHNGEPQRGRFELSQFTGLKDKNGKDIYEGDILEEDPIYKSRFEVIWDNMWCRYKLDCKRVCNYIQYPEWNRGISMSIIGNIYENPELLTNKTKEE